MVTPRSATVFAAHEDARRATRVGGVLALLAAALGLVLSLGVSRWSAADRVPLLALLLLIAVAGGVSLRAPGRMPPLAVAAVLLAGTLFVSAGMGIVGSAAVDRADNEMLFLLPVLYSAWFCRAWVSGLVVSAASAGYGAVLLTTAAAMPAARWLTTSVSLTVVAVLVTLTRGHDIRRLSTADDEARRDPLTGLLNRRGLAACAAGRTSAGSPISLLVLDIDHFKSVNDRHGHAVGDDVLVAVALVLREGSRAGDLVARLGGEEFVVVLPDCGEQEALGRARTLCAQVARASTAWAAPVTLSVGVASTEPDGAAADALPGLLLAADAALYAAKAAGRNTVRAASWAPPPRQPLAGRSGSTPVPAAGGDPEDLPGR